MEQSDSPDLYGLVGHPVAHSQSPRIHGLFAAQTNQHMDYRAIDVAPGQFEDQIRLFRETGGLGLNVTLPYKREAYDCADFVSGRARTAGVVNTLVWQADGSVLGDNTDGAGLVADLTRNLCLELKDARILVMGAGGGARGILAPLMACMPDEIVIVNRDVRRAETVADDFRTILHTQGCGYDDLEGSFDLVINATSASLADQVPPLSASVLRPDTLCYDMMYGQGPTAFLRWADDQGTRRLADGTGMLVEQAAESFYLWRQIRPDSSAVLEWLRGFLADAS